MLLVLMFPSGMQLYLMGNRQRTSSKRGSTRRPKARAADVLGVSRPVRIRPKWQKYYRRLMETREYLVNRRGDLTKDAAEESPSYSMHMADAGTDEFDRDLALSMVSSEQTALNEIDQAVRRIQDGTYGICELTGKRIEPGRLEAVPWTRFCAEAEKTLENEGGLARTRLGPRSEVPKSNAEAERKDDEEG